MMRRVRLGRSGLMVSPLALGTLTMSPLQKDFPPQRGAELDSLCRGAGNQSF